MKTYFERSETYFERSKSLFWKVQTYFEVLKPLFSHWIWLSPPADTTGITPLLISSNALPLVKKISKNKFRKLILKSQKISSRDNTLSNKLYCFTQELFRKGVIPVVSSDRLRKISGETKGFRTRKQVSECSKKVFKI